MTQYNEGPLVALGLDNPEQEYGEDVVAMLGVCFDPVSLPIFKLDPQTLYRCRHYRPRLKDPVKRTKLLLQECSDDTLLDNLKSVHHCIKYDMKLLCLEGQYSFNDTKIDIYVEEDSIYKKASSLLHLWYCESLPYSINVTFDELFFAAQFCKKRKL